MNAPLNTGLQQIIEQINGATADLRKSNEWFDARDGYIRDAIRGDDDWTRMDDEASAHALTQIHDALSLPAEQFKPHVQRILANLIQHAATCQADILQMNGRLPEVA